MSEYDDGGFIASSPRKDFTVKRTIRSFTIKSLTKVDIEEKPYKIDHAEVSQIHIVGWVKSSKQTNNGRSFIIDDTTGTISCNFWPRTLYEEECSRLIEDGNLLIIIGNLRVYEGRTNVTANAIKTISDPNYFTYHLIKCIHQHMYYNKMLKRNDNISEKKRVSERRDVNDDNYVEDGFSKIQRDILDIYRKNQDDNNGVHIDNVVRVLSSKYAKSEIMDNVNMLLHDCQLYVVEGLEYKIV